MFSRIPYPLQRVKVHVIVFGRPFCRDLFIFLDLGNGDNVSGVFPEPMNKPSVFLVRFGGA